MELRGHLTRFDRNIFVRYSFPLRGKDGMRVGFLEKEGQPSMAADKSVPEFLSPIPTSVLPLKGRKDLEGSIPVLPKNKKG